MATDSVQAGEGTWRKLPWGDLYKSIDAPVAIIVNRRGIILAEVFSDAWADRIIADHERAAWAVEARDALDEVLFELSDAMLATKPKQQARDVLARYPQQEGN